MRSSLRLFGLLTVLAGVNVYVFFFNRGTAPREVLKPSSTVSAAGGKAEALQHAAADARTTIAAGAPAGTSPSTLPVVATTAAGAAAKPKPPVALAPAASPPGAASPKGSPGGSPGASGEAAAGASDSNNSGSSLGQEKKFGEADTLVQVLAREGFESDAGPVIAALSRLFDPKLIRGGQGYVVQLDEQGEPESFEYRPSPVTRFVVSRRDSGSQGQRAGAGTWQAVREDQPLETKVVEVSGLIDSSLYESVQRAGEGSALAGLLVELLAWDVNFYTDTHPGDHWKVIVEKQLLGGRFYRYGHLLAAEYGGKVGTFRAFYWKPVGRSDGRYYDEKGQAISKSLLKTPLRYVRISSKFDRHRFHPILHREKAHLGVDYAAPVGTPIWASAGGKVVACEMKRGSGNTVVIAHAGGLATRYYHLSRFARGMKSGKVIKQKDVIGYVGTTGLSTGPHLHFSVTKNGAFVDPGKVQVSRDAPVPDRSAFIDAIRPRVAALKAMNAAAATVAHN